MKSATFLIALTIFVSGSATSLSLKDTDVGELYARSRLVVHAAVTSIRGECESEYNCPGYRIEAVVQSVVKQDSPALGSGVVSVCAKIPLETGRSYAIFLDDTSVDPIGMSNCKYVLGHAGAFEKRAGDWYRVNSPESAVIFVLEGRTYYSNAVLSPDFGEFLDRVAKPADSAE